MYKEIVWIGFRPQSRMNGAVARAMGEVQKLGDLGWVELLIVVEFHFKMY